MGALLIFALLTQTPDFLEEGNRALDVQDYSRAVEYFSKAAAADPRDYSAQFQLALAHSMLGQDAEAIPRYRIVLELNPGLAEAELNLGLSLLRAGEAASAVPLLESANSKKPGATAESALAQALAQTGKLSEAEIHYRKAAELDPARRANLLELAAAYEQAGKAPEAIAIYREFAGNAAAEKSLGRLLARTGRTGDAIAALEAAAAAEPNAPNWIALAQAHVAANQTAKAVLATGRAVDLAPRDAELRLFYGRLLRDQRKIPEAARQFQAAVEIDARSAEAWNELAAALTMAEQYPQALAALDKLRGLGAETPGNLFFRALAHDRLQQRPEAVAAYAGFLAASQGKFPDQEFQARQRMRTIEAELRRKR